jgi:hypothetical protein
MTEADFQAWRDERDSTAWKYAIWDAGKRMRRRNRAAGRDASVALKSISGVRRITSALRTAWWPRHEMLNV